MSYRHFFSLDWQERKFIKIMVDLIRDQQKNKIKKKFDIFVFINPLEYRNRLSVCSKLFRFIKIDREIQLKIVESVGMALIF